MAYHEPKFGHTVVVAGGEYRPRLSSYAEAARVVHVTPWLGSCSVLLSWGRIVVARISEVSHWQRVR